MEVRIPWTMTSSTTAAIAVILIAVCCLATQLCPVTAATALELNNCLPPSIEKEGSSAGYFIEAAKVAIPCIAKGDPVLEYQWYKDGETLDLTSEKAKKRMTKDAGIGGTLVIFEAKKEDAGIYQCKVVNNCGTALSIKTILLHATVNVFPQVSQPEQIIDVLGSSAVLTCRPPHSVPKAVVKWILTDSSGGAGGVMMVDDDDDDENGDYNNVKLDRRVTMDYYGNLYITSLRKEDEQDGKTYVCEAQNRLTRATMKGEDKIVITKGAEVAEMGVDLMWTSEDHQLVLQGKRARFKCIFSGQPEPVIKWYHGNPLKEVEGDDRVIVDHHELIIKDTQRGDEGKYMCSGQNSHNKQAKNHSFTLTVKGAPEWRVPPRDATVGVEEDASFDCDAVGDPEPSVQWFINGKPYSKDTSKGVLNGNTLSFTNLDKEDSQVIQCNASNIYGYIWSDVFLYVQALPPTILKRPDPSLIVARDSNVTLTCEVTGKPKPKVVWYKGSQPLNHKRFQVQDNGNLFIQETTMRDKGTYICMAENTYGDTSASGTLTVRDKTQIISKPVSEKVDYSNQVTFTCGAKTDNYESKNLKITWLKDGAPLDAYDSRVVVTKAGLTIFDTKSKDTGAYTCVAKSSIDNDTATATLEVRAPPDPPYNVVRQECLGKGARLTWQFDEKMRNFETMVKFIVEVKNEYTPNTWTKAHTVTYPTKSAMVSLSPYAKYWFRVRAVNKMGVGEASKPAKDQCKTLMAAPDKNPDNVRTDTQHTGYLVIKWTAMKEIDLNGDKFQYDIWIKEMKSGDVFSNNVTDFRKDEFRMPVKSVYGRYLIKVRSRNQAGVCNKEPVMVGGYSGEAIPKVTVKDFEVDPDINVTATKAGFRWSKVDTSPEMVQGKFQGYKIRFWKKGEKETTMHQEIIPSTEDEVMRRRKRRDVDDNDDGYVRGAVMNLPSFSEILADVVVINTNFESAGSNKVNLTTPEGVPGPVKFLEALNRGSYHIQLFWQAPLHPNGILTAYELSYRKIDRLDFGDLVVVSDSIPPDDERHTITGLEEDSKYRVYIKARTAIGWGKDYFIDIVTASELMVQGLDIDSIVRDLAAPRIENVISYDNEANVSWTLDLSGEGDRVGHTYYLQYKKKGSDKWVTSDDPITGRSWANLDHLDPGTTYQVRVIAKDMKNNKQEPSEAHSFHTTGVATSTIVTKIRSARRVGRAATTIPATSLTTKLRLPYITIIVHRGTRRVIRQMFTTPFTTLATKSSSPRATTSSTSSSSSSSSSPPPTSSSSPPPPPPTTTTTSSSAAAVTTSTSPTTSTTTSTSSPTTTTTSTSPPTTTTTTSTSPPPPTTTTTSTSPPTTTTTSSLSPSPLETSPPSPPPRIRFTSSPLPLATVSSPSPPTTTTSASSQPLATSTTPPSLPRTTTFTSPPLATSTSPSPLSTVSSPSPSPRTTSSPPLATSTTSSSLLATISSSPPPTTTTSASPPSPLAPSTTSSSLLAKISSQSPPPLIKASSPQTTQPQATKSTVGVSNKVRGTFGGNNQTKMTTQKPVNEITTKLDLFGGPPNNNIAEMRMKNGSTNDGLNRGIKGQPMRLKEDEDTKVEKDDKDYTLAGAARASFLSAAWFIGMMIAIAVLILILVIVCIVKRNRGDNYPVQEKERLRGNCDDNHDHFNEFGKGSDENGIGVSSSFDRDGEKVPLDADADSMDYGDDDASRFNEDGSFIGQYGTGDKANDVANVSASSIV